jgi:glutamate--cysteine ligase regulatory subunit
VAGGPTVFRKRGTNRSNLELVHSLRESIVASKELYGSPEAPAADLDQWTERAGDALFLPRIDWQGAGLRDERSQYEITVKLFLLAEATVAERERQAKEALDLVCRELGVQSIDLLIVAFPGLSFEGNCEWDADKINAQQGNLEDEVASWAIFEALHRQGLVQNLGVSEFGSEKLAAFLERTTVRPTVDQINLQDCCKVPPPLKKVAADNGVELNVHTDSVDILPRRVLCEILGGNGVLANGANGGDGLKGELTPQWVVRYLAFVRDRAVIENKGYFAAAELNDK